MLTNEAVHRRVTDIVIFGSHVERWNRALGASASVWNRVGVKRVHVLAGKASSELQALDVDFNTTVTIPLMEGHIRACPRLSRTLFPSPQSVQLLANKGRFADYVKQKGLQDTCPETYSLENAIFPCVLKRLDLNGCNGIAIASSREHLRSLLGTHPWAGNPYLLQEYVASGSDYVTHAVCRKGKLLWSCSYRYHLKRPGQISVSGNISGLSRFYPPPEVIADLQKFVEPLNYNGPVCFDYKISDDGALWVLEINPRLGGSLMLNENEEDLAASLRCIIEHAVLVEEQVAVL